MIKVQFGYKTVYTKTTYWKNKIKLFKKEEDIFTFIYKFNSAYTPRYHPYWMIVDFKII